MAIDERGRLFGRWNLLDLAVIVLVAGLIPLAYAGYLLFRDQPPTLVSVTPDHIQEAQDLQITIKGTNLRPYMRVSAGVQQARDFIFKNTEEAELPFAYLAPGTYDIILYDSAQERFRLKNALTVSRSNLPATEIIAIGAFGNLDASGAAKLTAGTKLSGDGEIISAGKPVPDTTDVFSGTKVVAVPTRDALRLPAVVKLSCQIRTQGGSPYCFSGDVIVAAKALLTLPTPLGKTPFQIQRVRSTQPVELATLSVRFSGPPSVVSQIKTGDVDTGGIDNEFGVLGRVESVGAIRPGGNTADVDVKIAANVQHAGATWLYDSAPIRIGGPIMLRTGNYEVAGVVTGISAKQ